MPKKTKLWTFEVYLAFFCKKIFKKLGFKTDFLSVLLSPVFVVISLRLISICFQLSMQLTC